MAERAKSAPGAIDRAFMLNIAAFFIIVGVYAATVLLSAANMDAELVENAKRTAERWFDVGIGDPDTITVVMGGAPLGSIHWHDLDVAHHVGNLNAYQLYNHDGQLARSPSSPVHLSPDDYDAMQARARLAIETGTVQTEIHHLGSSGGGQRVYVNVFKPVPLASGKSAVAMAQIDISDQHALAGAKFNRFVLLASTLAGLALVYTAASTVLLRRQRRYHMRIEQLVYHDVLTGIANRTQFVRRAPELIAASARKGQRTALYLLDLDNFKSVNDQIGHADGDVLISLVARRLVATLPGLLVARIGGDEFAALQPFVGSDAAARHSANAMLEAVQSIVVGALPAPVATVSVGFTVRDATHGLSDLMREAEVALQAAKADGRNRSVMFKDGMGETVRKAHVLRTHLKEAIRDRRMELFFQPLHRADSALIGFEALIRVPDPAGGYLSNATLVPIVEELGMIGEIGEFVLNEACLAAASWPPHLRVAVNVSPQEFEAGDILARFRDTLARTGLAPQRLDVEITENLFLAPSPHVSAKLHGLQAIGAALVMDDFGSGYSSLQHLWKFPFDKLKVDRSCIMSLGESDRVPVVLQTIRAMADAMHLRVTAEGIETEGQRAFAVAAGYDELQGHYFSPPLPQAEVAAYIRADEARRMSSPGPPAPMGDFSPHRTWPLMPDAAVQG